jgi:hypothetical protein
VSDLPALRYADMVITESLRLYRAAAGCRGRRPADRGRAVNPWRSEVFIAPTWVVHRDPRWYDAPEAFRPERWEGDLARRLPRFAYFPFGGGPRQCIGNSFAQMEAVLVLAAIAQRFRLVPVPGPPVRPVPSVTLRPGSPVPMRSSAAEVWRRAHAGASAGRRPAVAGFRPSSTWVSPGAGWRAHARNAAAIASMSARVANPAATGNAPMGDVSKRSAYESPHAIVSSGVA